MDSNKNGNPLDTDSRGSKLPQRLLRDLKKLQGEMMQSMPEGPRHCLSIDRYGQTQLLMVGYHPLYLCT